MSGLMFTGDRLAQVLDGTKTQTRRLVKAGECAAMMMPNRSFIEAVLTPTGRTKWMLYRSYAVQGGRGQKAVGRVVITGIRSEGWRSITNADARAEGFASRDDFLHAFKNINWDVKEGADVWVLTFKLVR
jgi:hypothetical protein